LGEPSTIREIGIGINIVTKTETKTYPIIETKIDPIMNIEIEIEIEIGTNTAKVKKVVSLANLALGHDFVAQDSTPTSQYTLNDQGVIDMIE
jgi:hypothetical protein